MKHWRVKYTRVGMEPPLPFGKVSTVVCAASRREAIESIGDASPMFRISASVTEDPVGFFRFCSCKKETTA